MDDRIIDACSLINVVASGRPQEILRAAGGRCFIPVQVRNEALTIRRPDEADEQRLVPAPLDLDDLLSDGVLQECSVEGSDEAAAIVRFAGIVEDGEAACLAIALCRGWTVATDDRKARRVARENGIAVITTAELLRLWAEHSGASAADVSAVLIDIRRFARFEPPQNDPAREWWIGAIAT